MKLKKAEYNERIVERWANMMIKFDAALTTFQRGRALEELVMLYEAEATKVMEAKNPNQMTDAGWTLPVSSGMPSVS